MYLESHPEGCRILDKLCVNTCSSTKDDSCKYFSEGFCHDCSVCYGDRKFSIQEHSFEPNFLQLNLTNVIKNYAEDLGWFYLL